MVRRDSVENSIVRYEGLLACSLRNWEDLSRLKPCDRVRRTQALVEDRARYLASRLDQLIEELRRNS